ncbi:MAG: glycosyltransferase family 4 protein [Candidatus Eremiobacteraeota bacterium]|nr:glycosyltransferase family 4 protein [Candidatus Eremiobacteraeota bacterium]
MLRLGVDAANLLRDRRGIGRYTRALLRHWIRERTDSVRVTLILPHLYPKMLEGRIAALVGRGFRLAARRPSCTRGIDLVWYPWNGMTWVAAAPKVATVHDVWPFASPAKNPRVRRNEQVPFMTTAACAKRIITDSQFSKSEIVVHLGADPQAIDVVPLGVDAPLAAGPPAVFEGFERYVLFVGEAEDRKGLTTLFEALERLGTGARRRTAAVIAGKRAAAKHTLNRPALPIIATGEVDDARLGALYRGARAFVFPSRYEGFGLPVLEAMAYGTPVIASDAASVPEAGGDAALYFKCGDAGALALQLERVLSDDALVGRLKAAGLRRAAAMTWQRCADATLGILEEVAARGL